MTIYYALTWVFLAWIGRVAAFIITAGSEQPVLTSNAAVITASDLVRIQVPVPSTFITSTLAVQAPLSTISITIAPSASPYVIRRQTQKCFNDQGFQVDCATWTGYYYSWGPPGNPYEGGPGDGQGDGSGSGSGSNGLVYQSVASSTFQLSVTMILGVSLLLVAILL